MMLPTVKHPNRHTQGYVPMVILNAVKLTVGIKPHYAHNRKHGVEKKASVKKLSFWLIPSLDPSGDAADICRSAGCEHCKKSSPPPFSRTPDGIIPCQGFSASSAYQLPSWRGWRGRLLPVRHYAAVTQSTTQ